MGSLSTLFAPECVAVIGATDSEGSVGNAVMRNLCDSAIVSPVFRSTE